MTRPLQDRIKRKKRSKRRLMVRFGVDKADRTGFTRNLSTGGLSIKTNHVFKPGTTMQMELQFPEKTVSLWGRVMWAKKVPPQLAHVLDCGMGFAIVDPPPDWEEFFRRWRSD